MFRNFVFTVIRVGIIESCKLLSKNFHLLTLTLVFKVNCAIFFMHVLGFEFRF